MAWAGERRVKGSRQREAVVGGGGGGGREKRAAAGRGLAGPEWRDTSSADLGHQGTAPVAMQAGRHLHRAPCAGHAPTVHGCGGDAALATCQAGTLAHR